MRETDAAVGNHRRNDPLRPGFRIAANDVIRIVRAGGNCFRRAAKGASPDVIPILEHGNQLLEQKDFAGARAEYEKALASVPDNPIILRAIAQTYYGEKEVDEAVTTLKKIVDLDPNDATALVLLANLQLEKGNIDEGKATLAQLPPDSVKDPAEYTNVGILLLNKNTWSWLRPAKTPPTSRSI